MWTHTCLSNEGTVGWHSISTEGYSAGMEPWSEGYGMESGRCPVWARSGYGLESLKGETTGQRLRDRDHGTETMGQRPRDRDHGTETTGQSGLLRYIYIYIYTYKTNFQLIRRFRGMGGARVPLPLSFHHRSIIVPSSFHHRC